MYDGLLETTNEHGPVKLSVTVESRNYLPSIIEHYIIK